ncbi:MAG: hypothetical protein WA821_24055 [Anaerolineales bacterium]
MADVRKSIKDVGIQFLRDLLNSAAPEKAAAAGEAPAKSIKASIDDLSLDDLRREKIRQDQEQRKLLARVREIEAEKKKLFEEGVRNASEREQRVIARRIKEIDVEATNMDHMLQMISKQMRIINGFLQVKERARVLEESGLSNIFKNMDLQDLIKHIENASVNGEFQEDKFNELLRTMEESESLSPTYKEDGDVMDIMKAMQQAREASDSPEAMEKQFEAMSQKMREKQKEKGLESNEEDL